MLTIAASLQRINTFMMLVSKNYAPVELKATISDISPAITSVAATLDWNDGGQTLSFGPAKPLVIDATRNLTIGTYYVRLTATNYRQPTPDVLTEFFTIEVQPNQFSPQDQTYLFGPILPLDDKYPNTKQWNFNLATNLDVLRSSVKMLLLTTKGERIMQPSYGTLLRRIVFEPNTDAITGIVQQEIDEALNQFEPRVRLDGFEVVRNNQREAVINADFVSKINLSSFSLILPFSQ